MTVIACGTFCTLPEVLKIMRQAAPAKNGSFSQPVGQGGTNSLTSPGPSWLCPGAVGSHSGQKVRNPPAGWPTPGGGSQIFGLSGLANLPSGETSGGTSEGLGRAPVPCPCPALRPWPSIPEPMLLKSCWPRAPCRVIVISHVSMELSSASVQPTPHALLQPSQECSDSWK